MNHLTRNLFGTGVLTAATAAVGSIASREADSTWYRRLDKPGFQPPTVAFPVVWTGLYVDLALTAAEALDRLERDGRTVEARAYRHALVTNLVLNGGWSWVFFRAHRLTAASVVAGALTVSSADLVRRTAGVSGRGAAALTPYPAWCAFATVLSTAIRRRNR